MKKLLFVALASVITLICLTHTACGAKEEGAKPPSKETVVGAITQVVKEAEKQATAVEVAKPIAAREAYNMALKEALKWDAGAKLYRIYGEGIKDDGSAGLWELYFSTQVDPQKGEKSKKCVVIVRGGKITEVKKAEKPEELTWIGPKCNGFLPDNWKDSKEAYPICISAFRGKHQDIDTYKIGGFFCDTYDPYYMWGWPASPSLSKGTPFWVVRFYRGTGPQTETKHAIIQVVTGEALVVE